MEPHWGGANRVYNASTGYDELQNSVELVSRPPMDSIGRLTSAAPPTRPLRLDTAALKTLFLDRFQKGLQLDCGKARHSIAHGVGDHDQIVVD
jgi:hypothetical protein